MQFRRSAISGILVACTLGGCFQVSGPIDASVVASDLERDGGPLAQQVAAAPAVQSAISQDVATATAQQAAAIQGALADAGAAQIAAAAANLQQSLQAQLDGHQHQLDALDAGLTAAAANIESLQGATTAVATALQAQGAQLGALDAGLTAATSRLAADEATLTQNGATLTTLKTSLDALDAGFSTELSVVAALSATVAQHGSAISALQLSVGQKFASSGGTISGNALVTGSLTVSGVTTLANLTASQVVVGTGGALTVGPTPNFTPKPISYGLVCGTANLSSMGGHSGVRQACVQACGSNESHLCTVEEATRSIEAGYGPGPSPAGYALEQLGSDCGSWLSTSGSYPALLGSGSTSSITLPNCLPPLVLLCCR